MIARLQLLWLALALSPTFLVDARRRALFREMHTFCRNLPPVLKSPLSDALTTLTPNFADSTDHLSPDTIRNCADLAALLDRRSPLGLCLRRSLTRYHFLRRANLPVVLQFGARFVGGKPDREITGHAWLTLDGVPYHESGDNWQGFAVMFTFPPA